jgi:ABC-type antimicrobial peptide transport system permease subunit
MVRATTDPDGLTSEVRRAAAQVDGELPLNRLMSMPAVIDRRTAADRFFTSALAGFASLALVLAAIGIYGLIAYSVGQRTYEIGIRMAMGAKPRDVLRLVVGHGMRLTAIGIAAGVVCGILVTRLMVSLLFNVPPYDPVTYAAVSALIAAVAFLAGWLPARRAARIDPVVALRGE